MKINKYISRQFELIVLLLKTSLSNSLHTILCAMYKFGFNLMSEYYYLFIFIITFRFLTNHFHALIWVYPMFLYANMQVNACVLNCHSKFNLNIIVVTTRNIFTF